MFRCLFITKGGIGVIMLTNQGYLTSTFESEDIKFLKKITENVIFIRKT